MDRRSNTATRRATIVANVEAVATDRLIQATDAALSKLWQRYDDHELRELASSLVFVKLKGNHLIVEKGTTSDLGPAP